MWSSSVIDEALPFPLADADRRRRGARAPPGAHPARLAAYVFGTSPAVAARLAADARTSLGWAVRDIRDNIEVLARLFERALEPEVVVGRHDEGMGSAVRPRQARRQRREEPVDGPGLDRRLEAERATRPRVGPAPSSSRRTAKTRARSSGRSRG